MKYFRLRSPRLLSICLLCVISSGSTCLKAQSKSPSSLSRYYLGETRYAKMVDQMAMGGVGIAHAVPGQYNILNPASSSRLNMTSMGAGGLFSEVDVKDKNGKTDVAQNGGFQYVFLAFPVGDKFGVGLSVTPYTYMGYDYSSAKSTNSTQIPRQQFKGSGGVSEAKFSLAYSIAENWSVGASVGVLFGSTTKEATYYQKAKYNTIAIDKMNFLAGIFGAGLMGHIDLDESHGLDLGVVATLGRKTDQDFQLTQRLFQGTATNTVYTALDTTQSFSVETPTELGVGVAYTYLDKLSTELDFSWKSKAQSERLGELKQSYSFNLGASFTPRANSISSYFERMSYLLGGYYLTHGVEYNGNDMYDMGVSAGLRFPFFRDRNSFITLGISYGLREFSGSNVLREKYFNAYLGITINQLWFIERKYD